MNDFEQEIRDIVRDEMTRDKLSSDKQIPRYDIPQQERKSWSGFESSYLIEDFWAFCANRAFKSGRSPKAIACKIRNLMNSEIITTW